ncbi:hypothetical protein sos41_14270 [Alphaproteobacteria bacterium SO-S41]|nr:hypothetical protein sos41_14270 [Alphaproteobacteria bacterium SO-S41]
MGRSRWIGHADFATYIDDYQAAGLDQGSAPPEELLAEVKGIKRVFASELQRSIDSARLLLPKAELVSTPLFTESPLASPRVPALRLKAPAWAVMSRIAWHGGFRPGIESYGQSKVRARKALELLVAEAEKENKAVLVAHGYFNAILGRALAQRGWRKVQGAHRVRYWNAVIYERDTATHAVRAGVPPAAKPATRIGRLRERIRRKKAA